MTTHALPLAALALSAIALEVPLSAQDQPARLELHGEQSLVLEAHWEDFADSWYKLYETYSELQNFEPATKQAEYELESFRSFLPDEPVSVGDTWSFDPNVALPLLRQFHPGARVRMRHALHNRRAWACLRALGPDTAEILLRVHGEFELVPGQNTMGDSSWLVVSQFAGRMLIDRKRGILSSFSLLVPPRNSNADINVPAQPRKPGETTYTTKARFGIADIGYIPRMELLSLLPPAKEPRYSIEMSERRARQLIARRYYRFAHIEWLDVATAWERAKATGKPLHLLTFFGSLDDESC